MELFRLLGKIVIDNADANRALTETSNQASDTANVINRSNASTSNSNITTGSSWKGLKTAVNEYKAQGLTTSQAWRQANADMKASTATSGNAITAAFSKIAKVVGTTFAVSKMVSFGKGCIDAAANVAATESQFTQVFGNVEKEASKSLSQIAETAGISENRMKGSFVKIAAFAKTTGMDSASSLKLSERAMVAVADSAAFYDQTLEDTTERLQSFLKGNYENDAALGLSCTETTRNAAANKLYGKSFKDLSEEQKQLTLLQMVEDANKLSGAMGQAARESNTWTNVTGNLKQAWSDLQATLGAKVLPKVTEIVGKLAEKVQGLVDKLPAAMEWVKQHKTELTAVGIVLGSVAAAIGIFASGMTAATVATTIATAASTAFAAVMAFITSPITLVILAIGALVAAFVVAYKKSDKFREIVDNLKEKLVIAFQNIKEKAIEIKDRLVEAWDEISGRCEPLVKAIKENLLGAFEDLKEAGKGLIDRLSALKDKFQPIADFLSGVFSSSASGASDWFDKLTGKAGDLATGALEKLNWVITKIRDGFNVLADFAGRLWDNLDPLVTLVRDNLLNSLKNLGEPLGKIKESFGIVGDTLKNHLIPALRDMLLPLWEKLKPLVMAVAGIIGGVLATAFGVISGLINGVVSALSGAVKAFSGVIQVVSNVFKLIVGIFTGNKDMCLEAVKGIWDGVCDVFGGLWDAVSGFLKGFVDGVVGFFKGLWDTLVGHSIVPDTIDGIVDCFSGIWDKVKDFVSGFVDGVVGFFTGLKDKAVEIAGNIKDKVVEFFGGIKDKAGEIWGNIKTAASEKWESIKSTVSEKASAIKDKASEAWDGLKEKTSSAFDTAKEKVSSAMTTVKDKVSSAASTAKDKISTAWNTVKDKTATAFDTAKDKATTAFNTAKDKLASTAGTILSNVSEKFESVKTTAAEKWEAVKSTITEKATSIKNNASSEWETLKSKTSTAFNWAKDKASAAFSTLKDKVSSYSATAKNKASTAWEGIKNKTATAFDTAKNKASTAFTAIKDKVSSYAEKAKNKASTAWEALKSKTSSTFSTAKDKASSAFTALNSKVTSAASSAKDKVSSTWNTVKDKTTSAFNSAKDKATSAFSTLKSKVSSTVSNVASAVSSKFGDVKSKVTSFTSAAKDKAVSAFSSMKSNLSSSIGGIVSTVSSKFGSIKDKISSTINKAKETVTSAVSKIKNAFNFSWKLPNLKLPHISVSGGKAPYGIGGAGSLPKFSIQWYRKAMDNAMLLDNPTIFGYSAASGNYLGAGDGGGTEVVAGSATLMKMIQGAVAAESGNMVYYLQKLVQILAEYFPQVLEAMERDIVFDGDAACAVLAPKMNKALGKIKAKEERGG